MTVAQNGKRQPPPRPTSPASNPYDAPQNSEPSSASGRSTLKIIGLVFSLCFAVLVSIGLVLYTMAISFLTDCSNAFSGGGSSRPREAPPWYFPPNIFWILIAASLAISVWLIYSLYRHRKK